MLSIRRAFTFVEFAVVLGILGFIAMLSFAVSTRKRENLEYGNCVPNLKRISLALSEYSQDWDKKLPVASIGKGEGWADSLQPYAKGWTMFLCPSTVRLEGTTDYFYNRRLERLGESEFASISNTIMLGECYFHSPSDTSLPSLPVNWVEDSNSPVKRHFNGGNYAFADGHVKWLRPEKITLDSPKKSGKYTFLPR